MDPGGASSATTRSRSTTLRERGRGRDESRVEAALRGRHARRRVPLHLHVGHDRPAEGLPALARQLPRDHRRRDQGQRARGRRLRLPLPAARARLRDPDPVRRLRAGRDARLLVAATRSRSSPTSPRSSRPTSRRCRGCSRRSTRSPRARRATASSSTRPWTLGVKVRMAREAGEEVPAELQAALRAGRGEALQERARPVRRQHPRVRDRRRADRARDPASSSTPAACR